VRCCAVLCCAVRCCAVLCCAVLCAPGTITMNALTSLECLGVSSRFLSAKVQEMILGEKLAPWENEDTNMLRKLGMFRRAVLAMLERDPEKRASIGEFLHATRGILSRTLTSTWESDRISSSRSRRASEKNAGTSGKGTISSTE
jgi:hypothetical protein